VPVGARVRLGDHPPEPRAPRRLDLDGNELSLEADEYEGRIFQHELDHLDGVLLVERLDPDQRKEARAMLRAEFLGPAPRPRRLASLLEL